MQAQAMVMERAPSAGAPVRGSGEEIKLTGALRAFGRDQEVFGEGEPADYVYKVASGAVRSFRILADGRRQIAEFHLPGDVFGIELDAARRIAAEAVGEATLVVARRTQLFADEAGGPALWRKACGDLRRSQDHALTLGRRSASERVAAFFLEMAERTEAGDILDLPMSRQDIADYLGLTIETVSRTITGLQADGLIDATCCRRIRLLDKHALAQLCQ
jgi:CRP/FNR family transcriptional regulator, nitrogen fixation regulation protein